MLPPALLVIHFLGFSYTHLAQRAHAAQNPFGAAQTDWPPIGVLYRTYWIEWLGGTPPAAGSRDPLPGLVLPALGMSLGLLLIAFVVSTALGLLLGVGATRAASPSALPGVRAAPHSGRWHWVKLKHPSVAPSPRDASMSPRPRVN